MNNTLLAALWLGPLPAMGRAAFSVHMLLHLGVVALVARLLVIGLAQASLRLDVDGHKRPQVWAVLAYTAETAGFGARG